MTADIAFDLHLDHGRCVGIRLPNGDGPANALAARGLSPEEQVFASTLRGLRRRTWVGGRIAMREALTRSGKEAPSVLADARGAPVLPPGVAGSISHKEGLAVALVLLLADGAAAARVGVDIEIDAPRPYDIASKVLTDEEAAEVAGLDGALRQREVIVRFSAKEAVYKALDPFVHRYVSFKEVAVTPRADGTTEVRAHLQHRESRLGIEARWLRWEEFVLTTARVTLGVQ